MSAVAERPVIRIRRAGTGDEHTLAAVGAASFLETFAGVLEGADILRHCQDQHAATRYADWLADPELRIWLAEVEPGAAPVGYLVLSRANLPVSDPRPGDREVKRIYLLHRFQGHGIGAALMRAAIDEATALGASRLLLGVYAHNQAAIAFYRKAGYVPVGERRFQVGGREYDDLVLALPLPA